MQTACRKINTTIKGILKTRCNFILYRQTASVHRQMHCNKELKDNMRSHIKTSLYVIINAMVARSNQPIATMEDLNDSLTVIKGQNIKYCKRPYWNYY